MIGPGFSHLLHLVIVIFIVFISLPLSLSLIIKAIILVSRCLLVGLFVVCHYSPRLLLYT